MKRAFLPFIAACLLLSACGDATTEKVSHGTTESDESSSSSSSTTGSGGMSDTMSTNTTAPTSGNTPQ